MNVLNFSKFVLFCVAFFFAIVFLTSENFSIKCSAKVENTRIENISAENLQVNEDDIFYLVNAERRKNNITDLVWDNQLSEMARNYSEQMARENFFDHFDPNGFDIVTRAKNAQLKHWSKIGENLFSIEKLRNYDAFAVSSWMRSPTHRRNILDSDFNTAGIGIARSNSGEIFITQIFIKR